MLLNKKTYLQAESKKIRVEKIVSSILDSGISIDTIENLIDNAIFRKKIAHINNEHQNIIHSSNYSKLPLRIGKTVSFVSLDDIKYILASGSYIQIETIEKSYLLRNSLCDILHKINNQQFIRIHRSTIININYMDKLLYSNFGEIDTRMKDKKLFRVGNSYKKKYLEFLGV